MRGQCYMYVIFCTYIIFIQLKLYVYMYEKGKERTSKRERERERGGEGEASRFQEPQTCFHFAQTLGHVEGL